MKNSILTILIVAIASIVLAQTNTEFDKSNFPDKDGLKEAKSAIKTGDEIMSKGGEVAFSEAIPYYEVAQAFNPNNALLNFKLGMCYLESLNKAKCRDFFVKAQQLDPKVHEMLNYYLGRGYHLNGGWDEAITSYRKHLDLMGNKLLPEERAQISKHIEECNNGKELVKKPVRVWIDNVGESINSKFHDYALVINADESRLFFTSRRPSTTGGKIDPDINDYFEDIYISNKQSGSWSVAQSPGSGFNTESHDASISLSADGQTLFLFRWTKKSGGDIFVSKLQDDGNWSSPARLDKPVNTDYHESSASLSPDNRVLYFVSNRDGGQGGRDIWTSRWDDKKQRWGDAINLGATINTPYDEEGVFMHPDGKTLYFSSAGHNSMGGMDIFSSTLVDGKWSAPVNLGYPINTPDHDVFFVQPANARFGYYTSIREDGIGGRDNYRITFLGPPKRPVLNTEDNLIASLSKPVSESVVEGAVEIKMSEMAVLKGIITDAKTGKPIKARIELVDNSNSQSVADFGSEAQTGKYLVTLPSGKNYGISIQADGYLFHSENFNIPADASFKTYVKNIELKRIEKGQSIVLKNIFFDSGKHELKPESAAEMELVVKIMTELDDINVEISGHTDSDGSAQLNQKLSENRAKAVVEYLIARGIEKERLTFVGHGKDKPIASNDTKEGKQENRRTEFKIVE
jgi:outer membrane protein OmpA-like peptidoglycan-associated protein